jgi:hypothetical protein
MVTACPTLVWGDVLDYLHGENEISYHKWASREGPRRPARFGYGTQGEDKDIVPGEIRAMQILPDDIRSRPDQNDDGDNTSVASTERHAFGCTDLAVPQDRFSPFVQFFRSVDWSSTVLGHFDEWPLQLH